MKRYSLLYFNEGICSELELGISVVQGNTLDIILPDDLDSLVGKCLAVVIDHHGLGLPNRTSMLRGMNGSESVLIPVCNRAAVAFAKTLTQTPPNGQSRHVA